MTGIGLPILAQAAGDAAAGPGPEVVGYALVAAGALDLLLAAYFGLSGRIGDERQRRVVAGLLAAGGVTMITLGILFWLGILGGGRTG